MARIALPVGEGRDRHIGTWFHTVEQMYGGTCMWVSASTRATMQKVCGTYLMTTVCIFTQCYKSEQFATWWRHQMEIFSALLALCVGNSPVTGEFPSQRPVTRSFDVFFDLRLNKRLSKQSWSWWLETTSRSLWRRYNVCPRPWLALVNSCV